jgi:MFS transporter, DHA2 family, glioxin efflux transporter
MSTTSTISTTEKVNPMALADVGEEPVDKGDVAQGKEQVNTTDDVGEYPSGFRLAMVILALVLAVFLVALDLVSRQIQNPNVLC